MKGKKRKELQRPKFFSVLSNDVICEHRDDQLPYMPTTPFHNHDGYEILLFLQGNANYFVESEGKSLKHGEVILTAPYAFHCTDASENVKYERIYINIKESYMRQLSNENYDLSTCFTSTSSNMINYIVLDEGEISEIINLSDKLIYELSHCKLGSDLYIKAVLIQILVLLNRKSSQQFHVDYQTTMPKVVSDTILYINQNIQYNISLEMIASYVHLNPDYLSRKFKEFTGSNIQQFIIAKRLTLSQKYLREGKSVSDACFLSGFSNCSNYSRSFSQHIGVSPKQFQKQ